MRTTDYPEGWTRTRDLLESPAAEAGDVVVLPWSAFRAFTWNRRTTSLDPAPRFLPRTTVVDDSLLVAGADGLVRVSGEDPRSEVVATALRAGRPLAEVLPGLGVRYVVVEGGTPGEVPATALAGLERLGDDSSLALWKVVGGIAPPPVPSTTSVVLVAASYLVPGARTLIHDSFCSVGVTSALLDQVLVRGRLRYLGRETTMAVFDREPATGQDRRRLAAELPWFTRNVTIKAARRVHATPVLRALGHDSPYDPY